MIQKSFFNLSGNSIVSQERDLQHKLLLSPYVLVAGTDQNKKIEESLNFQVTKTEMVLVVK